jgi:hypothetical protein
MLSAVASHLLGMYVAMMYGPCLLVHLTDRLLTCTGRPALRVTRRLLQRFPLIAARLALMIAQDGMVAAAAAAAQQQQQQQESGSQADPAPGVSRCSTDVGRISHISRMSTSSNGSSRWSHTLATNSMRSSNTLGTTSWQSSSSSTRRPGRQGSYSTKAALGAAGEQARLWKALLFL